MGGFAPDDSPERTAECSLGRKPAYAPGYILSPLRGWAIGAVTQQITRLSIGRALLPANRRRGMLLGMVKPLATIVKLLGYEYFRE